MTTQPPPASPPPDVVVIGGGIAGVSAAAHLAQTGRRVVLLERDELGAGASGRNSGIVQHPFDPAMVALHLETVELYRRLSALGVGDGTFALPAAPAGLLSVTHDPDIARHEADEFAISFPHLAPTFLGPGEVQALEPAIAGSVAACRLEISYPVQPIAATRAYAAHARSLGVEIREGVEAAPLVSGFRAVGARLGDGSAIASGEVVVAAGPWSPVLIDPTGSWRPIKPFWGVVVTVRLVDPPRHVIEEAASAIPSSDASIDGGAGHAIEADGDDGLTFSLVTASGSSSLGSSFRDDEPDPPAVAADIVRRGTTFVPAVASAPQLGLRACARPLSRDGRPLIGAIPWIDGLWIVAGHGAWGISTGPASGRLLADLVDGRQAAPPPEFDPGRFGTPLV